MARNTRVKKIEDNSNETPTPDRRVNRQSTHLDAQGRELPNPTPIAPPVGYKKHPTIAEQIRNMVASERLKQEAAAAGMETFEEADDFEVGDDFDPTSPYEEVFEPMPVVDNNKTLADAIANSIVDKLAAGQEPSAEPAAAPKADPAGPPSAKKPTLPQAPRQQS